MDCRLLEELCWDLHICRISPAGLIGHPRRTFKGRLRSNAENHGQLCTVVATKEVPTLAYERHNLSQHGSLFKTKQWVHFIGIGGCGLSALAFFALKQGWCVTGSDISWSTKLKELQSAGAVVHLGHHESHVWKQGSKRLPDHVVHSAAIPDSNVELIMAHRLALKIYKRGSWLAQMTHSHNLIAVSGSHGKSTTTAMLSMVLKDIDPTISALVGADVPQFPDGGSVMCGSGTTFILEADEYDKCFLSLTPNIALITNIEWEHVDMFPNEAAVREVFRQFCSRLKPGGTLIYCGDSQSATSVAFDFMEQEKIQNGAETSQQLISYGLGEENVWRASMIELNSNGGSDYLATCNGEVMARLQIQLPGLHNVLNSLAVIVAAVHFVCQNIVNDSEVLWKAKKKAAQDVCRILCCFEGVRRRFEFVGKVDGCEIYDDYAHHPTEIRASLEAAKQKFGQSQIWIVFQPHQYSRLSKLLQDFATVLGEADRVIVTEIYGARESNTYDISAQDLVNQIDKTSAVHIQSLDDVCAYLLAELATYISSGTKDQVAIITMGAGDITNLGPLLLEKLSKM